MGGKPLAHNSSCIKHKKVYTRPKTFCTGKSISYNMYLTAKKTPEGTHHVPFHSFSPWHVGKRIQDAFNKRNKQYSHNSLRLTEAALQVLKTIGTV